MPPLRGQNIDRRTRNSSQLHNRRVNEIYEEREQLFGDKSNKNFSSAVVMTPESLEQRIQPNSTCSVGVCAQNNLERQK